MQQNYLQVSYLIIYFYFSGGFYDTDFPFQ